MLGVRPHPLLWHRLLHRYHTLLLLLLLLLLRLLRLRLVLRLVRVSAVAHAESAVEPGCSQEAALWRRRLCVLCGTQRLRDELDEAAGEEAVAPVDVALQPPLRERAVDRDDLADAKRDGVGRRGVVVVHDLRLHPLLRPRRWDAVAHARLTVGERDVRAVRDALGDGGAEVVLRERRRKQPAERLGVALRRLERREEPCGGDARALREHREERAQQLEPCAPGGDRGDVLHVARVLHGDERYGQRAVKAHEQRADERRARLSERECAGLLDGLLQAVDLRVSLVDREEIARAGMAHRLQHRLEHVGDYAVHDHALDWPPEDGVPSWRVVTVCVLLSVHKHYSEQEEKEREKKKKKCYCDTIQREKLKEKRKRMENVVKRK